MWKTYLLMHNILNWPIWLGHQSIQKTLFPKICMSVTKYFKGYANGLFKCTHFWQLCKFCLNLNKKFKLVIRFRRFSYFRSRLSERSSLCQGWSSQNGCIWLQWFRLWCKQCRGIQSTCFRRASLQPPQHPPKHPFMSPSSLKLTPEALV